MDISLPGSVPEPTRTSYRNKPIKHFAGMTVPEAGNVMPRSYSVSIEFDLNQAVLKRIISAAQESCWSSAATKFQDGFLNQDPRSLPRTDPTLCTGLDAAVINQKKKKKENAS